MNSDLRDNLDKLEETRDVLIDAYKNTDKKTNVSKVDKDVLGQAINYLSYQINQEKNKKYYIESKRIL